MQLLVTCFSPLAVISLASIASAQTMRIRLLLCSTLVGVCLAVQPAGQTTENKVTLAGKDEPVAGDRPTPVKIPVVPLWAIEVRPRPSSVPEAEYPAAVRKARVEGLTVVEALVDVSGLVDDTRILRRSGNRSLDRAALAAARGARFSPAMSRDRPVRMWVTLPYRFVLTSGKGTAQALSISLVTTEARGRPLEVKSHNDSVLKPLRGLRFVHLKPIAPRAGAHGRLVPDSAAIRFNNEVMMAACTSYNHSRGGSLRRPVSCCLQSDWYYLVIDSGRCRVFQRNHPHRSSSRAEVYDVDTLMVKPAGLDTHYVEMPAWTALPQYVPLKIEFAAERMSRFIQSPTFRLEVR